MVESRLVVGRSRDPRSIPHPRPQESCGLASPARHQYQWLADLARYLASAVSPLLPAEREVVASGLQLSLVERRPDEPLVVALTMTLPVPDEESQVSARTAARVLRALQDEIALHLSRAWPLSRSGTALHVDVRETDVGIEMRFVSKSPNADDFLPLGTFVLPSPPARTVIAG